MINKLMITLALTGVIFCIITLPHISLFLFGCGIVYSGQALFLCALISALLGNIFGRKLFK